MSLIQIISCRSQEAKRDHSVCNVEKNSMNSLYEEYGLGYHSILVDSGIKVTDYFPIWTEM